MALPVDRAQSHAMNLQVLKRQDESVVDIVDMASHVVVYEFDQDLQSWKRKEVEGCLFVVKRYASPRFQIFVNNRLSTTNMTIPINSSLEVDSVDTFLILRSPDASAKGGFAIYGLWFFPEEDKEKILTLLQRMVQTVKEPSAPPTPTAPKSTTSQQASQEQPGQTQQVQPEQPPPQQPKPTRQPRQKQGQQQLQQQIAQAPRSGRGNRNKRDSNATSSDAAKPTTPTTILQRATKTESSVVEPAPTSRSSSTGSYVRNQISTQEPAAQPQHSAPPPGLGTTGGGGGYTPISREEGIAAGNAILGMLGGFTPQQTKPVASSTGPMLAPPAYVTGAVPTQTHAAPQPRSRASSSTNGQTNGAASHSVNKEQLKQTLIALLDEPQFFDQIYHAYVSRVHAARS